MDLEGDNPVCGYVVVATGTGSDFPNDRVVKLAFPPCTVPRHGWVSVQNVNAKYPWYWETQQEQPDAPADFRDLRSKYSFDCTLFDDDVKYMQDCLFGGDAGQPDFMFAMYKP